MYNDRRRQSAAVRYGPHHENTLNNILLRARNMESTLNNLKKEAEYITQRSWVIKKSNLGGRGLFASKFIKKGSLIFTNKPLVIGPRADCAAKTYCSICYVISEFCYPCDKCSLFICSKECGISQEHAKECAFILDYWKPKTPCDKKSKVLNQMLIYLRFFLLNEEQKQLVSFLQKSNNYSDFEELKALCSQYEIPKYQVQFIRTINAMIKLNSFRISESSCKKTIPLRGIFHLSSFLNHSCVPNTRNVFKNDYTMCVFASKDIEIGEEILTCYTGILWCTPVRRCHLKKTKNFWCKCRRCADPTEMDTKLSALKCFNKECVGFLIPLVPLNSETEWRCDNCKTIATPHHVSTVHSVLGSLVGILDLDDKFRLETVILEKISNFIPYSNHIFTDLRLRLALKIGFTEGLKLNELSESRLSLKESLCRGTLRTVAALGVGDAHLRGLLLYHLHGALAERARRIPDLYEELKSEIESTIEQAYNILKGDISAPPDLELRHQYLGPGCDKPHEERFFILSI